MLFEQSVLDVGPELSEDLPHHVCPKYVPHCVKGAAISRGAARRNPRRRLRFLASCSPDLRTGNCAYSAIDGKVVCDFDGVQSFETINGVQALGGSIPGPGLLIASGMLFVNSGCNTVFLRSAQSRRDLDWHQLTTKKLKGVSADQTLTIREPASSAP